MRLGCVLLFILGTVLHRTRSAQSQQDWLAELSQAVYGTLHSPHNGINTSNLTHGWSGDPFPAHNRADPPAAVLVARGTLSVSRSALYVYDRCRLVPQCGHVLPT